MSARPLYLSLVALVLGLALAVQARAAESPSAIEAQSRALQRASASVVGLRATAVDDARSAATLGRARQGSGVVIGNGDLVLTIGYLILEAEQVQLITDDEREVPARLIGYDVATGFGLVQPLTPLRIEPAPFGAAATLSRGEALMVVSGGEDGAISAAQLVSRRSFSGYWEYHVDGALFTSPARPDHSGAGLFNGRGELVGIGSLLVKDAAGPNGPPLNGNMFVPIDLLRPILAELRSRGSSHLSQRAWMGVNCVEAEGAVRVVRVNSDSPAEVAGLEPGDRIVRIDGTEVKALEVLWKTLWAGGAPEREVTLEIVRAGQPQTLKLQSVDRMKTLKRAQGI
ncbi:MAG: S1C family serine protease [Burkholderiaceae bacterium]|jgi:S1-C subfamily serine protease|nr:S1C family serine protease [Burkholderiaceae bacterium]